MDPPVLPAREWFVLARATSLHAQHLRPAIARAGAQAAGGAVALVGRTEAELRSLGFPPASARWVSAPDARQVDDDVAWARAEGLHLLPLDEAGRFPPRLAAVEDAPVVLWVRGDPAPLQGDLVAVVGSRHPTAGGERHARRFARQLCENGFGVTSGLARGIDAAAHEAAVDAGGLTIAVCATGLDVCYPTRNAPLARRIVAAGGALVSEFPPGTMPRADHFPRRNRVISGLSRGVLVVEAARDSGSLITARLALAQGRELLVVPGSIDSPVSAGCHALLRNGAALVRDIEDILFELETPQKNPVRNQEITEGATPAVGVRRLDKPREMLLDALGFEPASIDDLIDRTGHTARDIAVRLTQLELDGLVETLPGGRFGRLPLPPIGK